MHLADGIRKCGRVAALCVCITALLPGADPALTIYNQNFAVVRETLPLDLKAGSNSIRFSGATAHVEPDSVILRDATGRQTIQVLEQNYRNDPVSQERLLGLYEGKTIEFAVRLPDGSTKTVTGKIIRSGYVPHYQAMNRYGSQYAATQMNVSSGGGGQPVIEVGGQLQFSLPGQPIFPGLGDDSILRPTLDWLIHAAQPAKFDAELSYISGGMRWESDYNIVGAETGDTLDLVGWVTLDNQSGKQFDHARIKLMAGDVNKVQPQERFEYKAMAGAPMDASGPQVTERAFDEYHLYVLPQPTTLRDRETKQVEFLRAAGVHSKSLYVYDGARFDRNYNNYADLRQIQQYGTQSNPKVWVMREFANTATNHLGMPLPKGRVRFYRRDRDGQMEFTGENEIAHTAKDETVRVYTGNAFDLTGERRQTKFQVQNQIGGWLDESFEIKLRNHKKEPATVRVVEHLYRWSNWVITSESMAHRQTDSKTIEYDVQLRPDEEKVLTYTAHYTW